MAENVKNSLTTKQRRAAEALASGLRIEEAALAAQVSERTIYRYLQERAFTAELQRLLSVASDEHMRALTGELASNRAVMTAARDDEEASWTVRLKAADMLSSELAKWREIVDFEQRLLELEQRILNT